MNYTHGVLKAREEHQEGLCLYGVRGEGKAYSLAGTPLVAQLGLLGESPALETCGMRLQADVAKVPALRVKISDDGGTLSSSFRSMEFVGAVVGLQPS